MVNNKNNKSKYVTKQQVRSLMSRDVELKRYDTTATGSMTSTGVVYALSSGIIDGSGSNERTGLTFTGRKLSFRLISQINVAVNTSWVRAVVFSDLKNLGTAPVTTTVLQAADITSMHNTVWQDANRFRIYYDKTFTLSANGDRGINIDSTFNLGTLRITSDGATNVSGPGHCWLLLMTDNGISPPDFLWRARLYYTDQ